MRPGWGGSTPHQEGDFVLVQCAHCRAKIIGVVVTAGATLQHCPRCYRSTKIIVSRDDAAQDWRIEVKSV